MGVYMVVFICMVGLDSMETGQETAKRCFP